METRTRNTIHPTAVVSPKAELAPGVVVGPYSIIGDHVVIGENTRIGPGAVVEGPSVIGKDNEIAGQCAIGTAPQDLKYKGEATWLYVGDRNRIREFVTVNRGTAGGTGKTVVGSGCLLMTGVHIAHDCSVGDEIIFANAATLAGHVEVGSFSTVGAFCGVHQFCRVGEHAFIGGYSVMTRDVLPYVKTVGIRNEAKTYGVNSIGLERRGFSKAQIDALQHAYRVLFLRGMKIREAAAKLRTEGPMTTEVEKLLDFIESSERGYVR